MNTKNILSPQNSLNKKEEEKIKPIQDKKKKEKIQLYRIFSCSPHC